MKKLFYLIMGGVITLLSPLSVHAAPLAPQPLGKLLGLKSAPVQSFTHDGAPVKAPAEKRQAPYATSAEGPVINASVVYPSNAQGMWSYNTSEWNPRQLAIGITATGGGFAANGYYYITRYLEAMGFEEIKTINYNISDWSEYDSYSGKIEYVATTMAYHPQRDEVYGCFINPERNGYNFALWNYSYFQPSRVICPLERPWSGCAVASDGTLYAIERNGDLYSVDIKTGEMTLIGATGVESTYMGDATIDPATDTMYWSVTTDTDFGLYSVDITTAKATKLYDLINEEQLCGMYIPAAEAATQAGAPAKISSVNASFSGASMTGKIIFTSPRVTFAGDALPPEDEISYTIKANGTVIAKGTCLPNKRTEVAVEMTEPDSYYFTVTTSNSAGESPVASARKFVGPDTPKAPSSFAATVTGNSVKLQWNSPSSSGVNGGNVDYSNAVYRIVRYPDEKVIAEAETGRTITDELPSPEVRTDYYYTLTATVNSLSAQPVKSPVISMGPILPPFNGTFTSQASLAGWTILDVNDDNTRWSFYSSDQTIQLYASQGFDDWAITPAVKLRGGTSYPFSITVKTSNYAEETFEVKWGTSPTAEAMTNTVIAPATLKTTTLTTYEGEISTDQAATIYIGIHGMTPAKSNTLKVSTFTIGDGITAKAPAAVSSLKAQSPVDGTRLVTLTFTAPANDLSGQPLSADNACTKIEVLRDGKPLATLTEGIGSGKDVEYIDKSDNLTNGTHLYTVIPYNVYGEGPAAEAEVLVGARRPVAPKSALMMEEGNSGKVTISWDAVTTDVDGNTFSPDAVTYRVIDRQYNTVADNVEGTSVTLSAVPEGEQAFCQFAVYAVTAGGESESMAATAYKPVGTPYPTPWAESFKNRTVSSIFGYNYIKGQEPWQFVSAHDWGITPQDDDGGFAYLECYGDLTALVTGKMDLDGLNNPAFIYHTYNYAGSQSDYSNVLELQVDNGDGRGFMPVQSNVVSETGPANQWNKVVVPLTDYEGQTVIFRIEPKTPALALYTLDNIRVSSYVEQNLTASNIVAPGVADVDKPFEINCTVTNTGERAVASYTVELWRGEEPVDFVECQRIEPNASKNVTFTHTLGILDGEEAAFKAVIVCGNDMVGQDNVSETVNVGIVAAAVPAVDNLKATASPEGAQLSWSEPDISTAPADPYTETFDNAESWSNLVEGWKILDEDKIPVGGINTKDFPCTGLQAWFVVDNTWAGFGENENDLARWAARSGTKFMASEYVMRGDQTYQSDDWMISPMLYGGPQALTFYAKSFDPKYLETFEVLASSTTTNIDDFESIGSVLDVPNNWMQYRFKLPEGTRYAAIRSRSSNKFFLFVDDVTYIPADGTPASLEIKGYNIYRNGIKLNDAPVAGTEFTDATAAEGKNYEYMVTTVYDKGESRPSNKASLLISGIDATRADGSIGIRTADGTLIVTGLQSGKVNVAATDGRIIRTADSAPVVRIPLPAGIYIVTAGNRTVKIAVK